MPKYIVIFVEGETEEELYKNHIIPLVRNNMPNGRLVCEVEVINVRGAGGFKNDSLMKFKKIKKLNSDKKFVVAMCYDTDIFEVASKPPINWNLVEMKMKTAGADKIIRIKAEKSIEDWMLYDLKGICRWLRITPPSKINGNNGYEKLQNLFRKSNKTYIKGKKVSGLLEKLDVNLIISQVGEEIDILLKELKNNN